MRGTRIEKEVEICAPNLANNANKWDKNCEDM
jgi:hypothetical protein